MQDNNAPGETRTPNLLIRSQSQPGYAGLRRTILEWDRAPEAATETPKDATGSHNNSHDTFARDLKAVA